MSLTQHDITALARILASHLATARANITTYQHQQEPYPGYKLDTALHASRIQHGIDHLTTPCAWTEDADGVWITQCGASHIFPTGTPTDNHYAYCPYCGQILKQTQTQPQEPQP